MPKLALEPLGDEHVAESAGIAIAFFAADTPGEMPDERWVRTAALGANGNPNRIETHSYYGH